MTTDLVLAAINQAIFTRHREGVKVLAGLVHHNDAGSQYTSVRFTERLLEEGIDASVWAGGCPRQFLWPSLSMASIRRN